MPSLKNFILCIGVMLFLIYFLKFDVTTPEFSVLSTHSGQFEAAIYRVERGGGGLYFRLKDNPQTFFYSGFAGERDQVTAQMHGSKRQITVWSQPVSRYDYLFKARQVEEVFQLEIDDHYRRTYDEIDSSFRSEHNFIMFLSWFFFLLAWLLHKWERRDAIEPGW